MLQVAGLGFAMVMALVEFCFKSNVEAKRSKTTLSDAMKTKARYVILKSFTIFSFNMYNYNCKLKIIAFGIEISYYFCYCLNCKDKSDKYKHWQSAIEQIYRKCVNKLIKNSIGLNLVFVRVTNV